MLVGAFAQLAPISIRLGIVGAIAALVLVVEIGLVTMQLPQNARQVPQWMTTIPTYGALQFGVEMGSGLRTYVPTALPHLALAAILLLAQPVDALVTGLGFGLARSTMLATVVASSDPAQPYDDYREIGRLRPLVGPLFIALLALTVARSTLG